MLKQKSRVREVDFSDLTTRYLTARSRLILLDFDGTLVPFQLHPKVAIETDEVKSMVGALATDPQNQVMIVSGRDRDFLDEAFPNVNFGLAAEHGAFYKDPHTDWRSMFVQPGEWIQKTLPVLNSLAFRNKGAIVENKMYSIAWHYRALQNKINEEEVQQILAALRSLPEYDQFIISESDFTIELRSPGVDKGAFLARWINNQRFDFILAIGDSETDEDMFRLFDTDSYTIKVGANKPTSANYFIKSQTDVLPMISRLLSKAYKKVLND